MVLIHMKNNEESLFMFNTTVSNYVEKVLYDIVHIQNGRIKISCLCFELELLCDHGPSLPVEMHGLTDEQINELHLVDQWTTENQISKNTPQNKDVCNKRNGYPPSEKNTETIKKTISRVKGMIHSGKTKQNEAISTETIGEAFDILKGAVLIAYPMNLPPYDPIRIEIENYTAKCDHDNSKEELDASELWFAGKKLLSDKKLSTYFGNNEKTKVVVKLQKKGSGAPSREPLVTEEESKLLMISEFKRREELKKLMTDHDDSYFNSNWADPAYLKKSFHGLNKIKWKP